MHAQNDTTSIFTHVRELEEIEVIGQRNPTAFSEVARVVTVIRNTEIEKTGIKGFQDLLEFAANVDVRQRGGNGIQSDASIRGGSFDHVLVLLNGIPVADPQTGHVSLDLPVDLEIIERIEVLQGPGARIFGTGAFSGAVNIVTKENYGNTISASQSIGEFGFNRTNASISYGKGPANGILAFSHSASRGYAPNTDFSLQNLYIRQQIHLQNTFVDVQGGYQHKKFGANGFYSPRFPGQYEEADIFLGSVKVITGDRLKIVPVVFWRRRNDHFVLVRENPAFYQNFHRTDAFGSQLNMIYKHNHFTHTASLDLRSESIISNNIGYEKPSPVKIKGQDSLYYDKQYDRTTFSYFQELTYNTSNLNISGGLMLFWNTTYPDKIEFFPGLDMSYRIFKTARLFFSCNRALNLPTFTDLFYSDPNNEGNIRLSPNHIHSYEGGIRFAGSKSAGSLSVFTALGRNIIDWLWSYEEARYSPVNLLKSNVTGLEASLYLNFADKSEGHGIFQSLTANYMFLSIDKSAADSVSKYYNLRHKMSIMLRNSLFRNIEIYWKLSYQDRLGNYIRYDNERDLYYASSYKPYFLLDIQIEWSKSWFAAFVDISNILNTRFVDAGSLDQPGRWIKGGIRINFTPCFLP